MAEKTETGAENESLRDEVERLRADLGAIGKTLHDIGSARGGTAYSRLRDTAGHAGERIGRTAHVVGHEIEERPFIAVLAAFVLGVLLGALLRR